MVTVRIDNEYSDGHKSSREVVAAAPRIAASDWQDGSWSVALEDWFNDEVYDETGDGHGDGSHGKLGSCYTATIIAADDPRLVGEEYEWID